MNPVRYSIKDLERITGIKAHTIRMWEKRYGIIMPERTNTNIRFYTDRNLQKLLNISVLNKNGLKISQISELSEDEIIREVEKVSDSSSELDANINSLIMAAIEMQEDQVDETLNSSVLKLGFERTFCDIVFPMFEKISVFWQIGRITSCQERFVKNLIRQKLLVAIDGLVGTAISNPRKFILFTPTGDFNETGLLFANYIIRKSGHELLYLGPSVPLDHLRSLPKQPGFNEILININHPPVEDVHKTYLNSLKQVFPDHKLHIIYTDSFPGFSLKEFENTSLYKSFSDFSSSLAGFV